MFPKGSKDRDVQKHRIHNQIGAPEVMVVDATGKQLGVMQTYKAIQLAQDDGLDLVEVSGGSRPPVCRILDYGKLKFKEQKKAAEARKKTSVAAVKELRIRYSTDKHDLETKIRQAKKFLSEGDRVRYQMRFRGRESTYHELGAETFRKIIEELKDIADIDEKTPLMNQRMIVSFVPK